MGNADSRHAPPANHYASTGLTQTYHAPTSLPQPGAYRMPGLPSQQRFQVVIPPGVRPGQHFAVLVNGQQIMVRCPEGRRPGERFVISAAPRQASSSSNQFVVVVPPNVTAGQEFRVMVNGHPIVVTCPVGARSGQRVSFNLPQTHPAASQQQQQQQRAAPNHQLYEVAVPEGVKPGQPFALIANGQKVLVTCPPNVRPGQRLRFQLPIQLSQQQVETIRVSYDKDGWMRCLGIDLKFHWIYNRSENFSNEPHYRIPFDVDTTAFVRDKLPTENGSYVLTLRPAVEYAMDTTVARTDVNYQELSTVATRPFTEKVSWLQRQFGGIRVPLEEGHIRVKIRRSHLLQDAMDAIESIETDDMKKLFRFEFIGEPALDAGGVSREFYAVICQQLFNPDCGLFLSSSVNQMCMQINWNSGIANEAHLRYFHMAGRILGKILMDGHIAPVHLVQPMYKHLMGWPVTLRDLEQIDNVVYRNLINLLSMEDVSVLDLDFTVSEDRWGSVETVELVQGGANINVTNENVTAYLEAQLRYRLMGRIRSQLTEFLKGFYDVIPEPLLAVFNFQELELLLHGLPNISMDDWMANTVYSGEFINNKRHLVIQWFWEIVRNYSQDDKAKLLQFATGTSGVPAKGFSALMGVDGNLRPFNLHGDSSLKVFPRAHTCFNRIDLPLYKTKAEMQKYLTLAISLEATGFGIE